MEFRTSKKNKRKSFKFFKNTKIKNEIKIKINSK